MTFSGPSLEFCLRHRSNLFPSVPIVFVATGSDLPDAIALEPGVTGLHPTFDAAATLRMALRLHPRTRQVYIVESAPEGEHGGASRVPSGLRTRRSQRTSFLCAAVSAGPPPDAVTASEQRS